MPDSPSPATPIAFWFWNGTLTPTEVVRQARLMREAGVNEFVIHARKGFGDDSGQKSPYLGEAWFEACTAAIEEAHRSGMKVWLYDEINWPSGSAGGRVTLDQGLSEQARGRGVPAEHPRGVCPPLRQVFRHHHRRRVQRRDPVCHRRARAGNRAGVPRRVPARTDRLVHRPRPETHGPRDGPDQLGTKAEGLQPIYLASAAFLKGGNPVTMCETGAALDWDMDEQDLRRVTG